MARTPLAPVSASGSNRRRELLPTDRAYVQGLHDAGLSYSKIRSRTGYDRSTIAKTIATASERDHHHDKPRSGRPRVCTDRDERRILRAVHADPGLTYLQLKTDLDLSFSTRTIRRLLREHNIVRWRRKRRFALTPEHAAARLVWARAHKDWTVDQWRIVMWSDECSVEQGKGKREGTGWIFRTPGQKWTKDTIQPVHKGKRPCSMVWASFGGFYGRSDLIVMERDEDAPRNGYSARSYLQALEEAMPTI